MNADALELGATYFRVTYADVAQTMPGVEPLVYAGADIFGVDTDGVVKHYFQDAVAVVRFGLCVSTSGASRIADAADEIFPPEGDAERIFWSYGAGEIGETIVDLMALADVIGSAIERAQMLSFPTLAKARGKWI